ncbi:MAG TPA: hypothetical protein VE825_00130 [Terriglobales bacterium]|jgi:hypothetical protein|nr:hypothetical protein [Terriglobales bacterium]
MLVKKLIVSAMGTGLLWAAGLAGHAALASHPGLLLLAGQVRLTLGDREGGLRLMQTAVQQDQTSQADQPAAGTTDSAAASPTRVHAVSAECPTNSEVRRVASSGFHSAGMVAPRQQVLPADFAGKIVRRERRLVRLSLEQVRDQQVRLLVLQHMRDVPQAPAVPVEPTRANP